MTLTSRDVLLSELNTQAKRIAELRAALDLALHERDRTILQARELGASLADVARELGVTRSGAQMAVRRAAQSNSPLSSP